MILSVDKSDWKSVTLGEVVRKVEENDKANARNRFDRFLKVQHMDAETLRLSNWAEQKDQELPPTFYKIFRKGQILYPTRNPHLRRTALASFDGICGEKTLTLQPNEEKVDKDFIPFLFHSQSFYNHTTNAIVGSTNPHVRWRDVANYQFLLPPKPEQARLAELLWAGDAVLEGETKSELALEALLANKTEALIHGLELNGKTISQVIQELKRIHEWTNLGKLGRFLRGKSIPKKAVQQSGVKCVRYGEIYTKHHRHVRSYSSFVSKEEALKATRLKHGDILFATSGETMEDIGKSASILSDEEVYAGSDIAIFTEHDLNPIYSGYLMNSLIVRQQLNKYGTGAIVIHIYPDNLQKVVIPIHSALKQAEIATTLESIRKSIDECQELQSSTRALQKSLINQIF
ncbi:restriction endonuclease subunit S [Neolewinella agarilytica]|uniref:restriction endonuclease subunit S n=1 Tax=Neolewinella agarilytica TaxID=478744 RepID=UPI002356BE69|nr:restriction endonuclease subunit S [Neolewinella agarilytica]